MAFTMIMQHRLLEMHSCFLGVFCLFVFVFYFCLRWVFIAARRLFVVGSVVAT